MKPTGLRQADHSVGREVVGQPPLTVSRKELLVEQSDHAFREFVHGMLAFAARLETIRSRFGALISLSGIQHTVLISIAHLQACRDISVRLIADHLHLRGAFVTSETNKLVNMGLIEKLADQHDRRRVRITVTPQDYKLLATLAPAQRQATMCCSST